MDKRIKILYTIPSLNSCDGIASYSMNYFRYLNHEKYQIDFLVNAADGEYINEVKESGGNVFTVLNPMIGNMVDFLKEVNIFFKDHHDYDIIHCHAPNTAAFYLHYAKKYKIGIRILHSHVTKSADILPRKIRNDILIPAAIHNATHYTACTRAAGSFLFKKRRFKLINNAIELKQYDYCEEVRRSKRKELQLENKLVIGCVGRFCNQKNPIFLIKIFEEIYRLNNNAVLLFIGEGQLESEMKALISTKKLDQAVIFAGTSKDVSSYYQAMDVFVLPSRYEGLGIVYIEAQVSGLPVFASSVVPKETRITSFIHYVGLNESPSEWAKKILKSIDPEKRSGHVREGIKAGFSISSQVRSLEKYYKQLILNVKRGE